MTGSVFGRLTWISGVMIAAVATSGLATPGLATSALATSALVFGDCALEQPVEIGSTDLLGNKEWYPSLVLEDVSFNEVPRFSDPEDHAPGTEVLKLNFYNVLINGAFTGGLGVSVESAGRGRVGMFSNGRGNFNFEHTKAEGAGGQITYRTKYVTDIAEDPQYPERHLPGLATTETSVTVAQGKITSVSIKIPVFRVWQKGDLGTLLGFTGDHQDLCLTRVAGAIVIP